MSGPTSIQTRFLQIMREQASELGLVAKGEISGLFINSADNKKKLPKSGSTYGFCAQLTPSQKKLLFAEVLKNNTGNLNTITEFNPMFEDAYPLYWGKDKSIGARLHQHLTNPKGTGAVRLSQYKSLHGLDIVYALIITDDYRRMEKALQKKYPHLLKTTMKQL